jgi:ribonuclease P protein component
MLAANHRMRRGADFTAALRGRRAGSRCVVVALSRAADDAAATPLIGFVVSKAVGRATTRNLVRRRLRHAVAPRVADLAPGSRLVIRALPASASASYDEIARDLDSTLARVTRPVAGAGDSS